METIKPVIKKSKTVLKRIRNWKPFTFPKREGCNHTFLNFSMRVQSFQSMMCDSDQEFLNISFQNFELDTIFKPRSKIVLRSFLSEVLVEDLTQFTLFPKVGRKSLT